MSDLAISIINYKTGEMTIAAVASVLEALQDRDAQVVVVDNASGDGSADEIAAYIETMGDSRISLVRSATNSGFSGGHNQGIAAAPNAEYYLILNSDAVLRPGFFDAILEAANANPKVGMVAPRLEWDDGPAQQSCFRFASPQSEIIRGAGSGPVTKMLSSHVVALELPPDPSDIEWASFACILLRGDMVRSIGDMDDGYFLYFEDAEYALRATRAGWGVIYTPDAKAVHFRGGSGPVKKIQAAKKRLPAYYWRSRTRFFRQAYGPLGPFLANLGWLTGRVLAHTRLLAGRKVPPSNQSEWRDIWTGFLKPLEQAPETRA